MKNLCELIWEEMVMGGVQSVQIEKGLHLYDYEDGRVLIKEIDGRAAVDVIVGEHHLACDIRLPYEEVIQKLDEIANWEPESEEDMAHYLESKKYYEEIKAINSL